MAVIEHEPLTVPQVGTPVTTREVLHRAADLLEEFGWCQYMYGSKDRGRFCAAGAVGEALEELGAHVELPDSMRHGNQKGARGIYWLTMNHPWWRGNGGTAWNDTPGRTKAEVVARLRHAAETAA